MDQKQMEQTLSGLLLTVIEMLSRLEPYTDYHDIDDYCSNYDSIRNTAARLNTENWGVGSGCRTLLEDIRLSKIEAAINALALTEDEKRNINFYAWHTHGSPSE